MQRVAQAFATAGMNVMLKGLGDMSRIEATRKDIASSCGVEVVYSGADISKADDIFEMVEDARTTLGDVDVLVNNAGIQHVEAIETFTIAKWDAIIAIDLSSAFHGKPDAPLEMSGFAQRPLSTDLRAHVRCACQHRRPAPR